MSEAILLPLYALTHIFAVQPNVLNKYKAAAEITNGKGVLDLRADSEVAMRSCLTQIQCHRLIAVLLVEVHCFSWSRSFGGRDSSNQARHKESGALHSGRQVH